MKTMLLLAGVALATVPSLASAERIETGTFGDITWTARSMLVGVGPTNAGNGNTPNTAPMPQFSGTVGLLMNGSVCSGTLLNDRRTILTAAHCVADTAGKVDVAQNGVTVFFRDPGTGPDVQLYYGGPGYSTIQSSEVVVNSLYSGAVIDQNDIAVVRLSNFAPNYAESYGLYTGDLTGKTATITGYGSTSSVGGAVGVNTANPNRLGWFRQGTNMYDFRFGDEVFENAWEPILGPRSRIEYSYISDFDSGLAVNDLSCRITQASNFGGRPGTRFCDLGTGATEVGVAGGDSGGGSFIDGKVASVNSYGLSFGPAWGDSNPGLNSSYGEFSGYVSVSHHAKWIAANMVPEPSTWALMILGFGAVGGAMRRRNVRTAVRFA